MTDIGDQFDEFWRAFPKGRKTSKGKARRQFVAIVSGKHKDLKASADELINGATRYAQTMGDNHPYVKMPSTWLNGGCWDDEDLAPNGGGQLAIVAPQATRERSMTDDLNDRSWAE
ncbi:MAG: hypothetical protein QNK32_09625 [Porticoccus sp.]|nr:hypothetical protein [Porticoccus sp.]